MAIRDPEIESQARQEWLRGFVENGIASDIQINHGLAKCRAHDSPFLPSIGQFIAWCNESSGPMAKFPGECEAKLSLTKILSRHSDFRDWENCHPVVYWIYGQKSSYDWAQMTTKEFNMFFPELWATAIKMAKTGYQFQPYTPPARQVEFTEESKLATPEQGADSMNRIMSLFASAPEGEV